MQPTNENLLIVKLAVRENIWTQAYEIPTKKILNTQSTREKKFRTHEIPMMKTFLYLRNTDEGTMALDR